EHIFHLGEITGGPNYSAFGAIVAGQNPKAVLPRIVNDVVNMANLSGLKSVGDGPGSSGVGRGIDVHLVAIPVVKIFSPENPIVWRSRDVEWACAAGDPARNLKFGFARGQGENGARNSGNQMA